MFTLLKSDVGPFPAPSYPRGIDMAAEDRTARRRLYPVTVVYSLQLATVLALAIRAGHGRRALAFLLLGAAVWGPLEYLVHRYLMHGVFPKGQSLRSRVLHSLFDASHADHHARPWDGHYINGHFATVGVAAVAMPLSLLAPAWTASVFMAALLVAYVLEEWAHHAMHFWNFDWQYFQYVRRRHMWHHSPRGAYTAYGVTSGLWDVPLGTRIPAAERRLLKQGHTEAPAAAPTELAS